MSHKSTKEAIPTVSITKVKEPKTIKVRTVVIGVAMFVALVASFIGGLVYANVYTDTVHAQAVELSKHLK